jgi:hypothetical protein
MLRLVVLVVRAAVKVAVKVVAVKRVLVKK